MTAKVSVTIYGTLDCAEVVQLYVREVFSSIVVPSKELRGFKDVKIKAAEVVEVGVDVPVGKIGLCDVRRRARGLCSRWTVRARTCA